MTKLKEVEGYGIIGGHDQKDLEPEKAALNSSNEWERAIRKYLASGEKILEGGRMAINAQQSTGARIISGKQRAALRRS